MYYNGVYLFLTVLIINIILIWSKKHGEPPKLKENSQPIVHSRVGESLKLNCPIFNFKPRGDFEWFIKEEGHWLLYDERIKVKKSRIVIKNLTREDEGEYRCKATNGYGALSFTYYVYVRDETSSYTKRISSPKFINKQNNKTRKVRENQYVMLDCGARAEPKAKIEWYRGETLLEEESDEDYLKLEDVKREDSGPYKCKVWNVLGKVERSWNLQVGPHYFRNEELNDIKFLSSERQLFVNRWQDAEFKCQIRLTNPSASKPKMEWAKVSSKTININSPRDAILSSPIKLCNTTLLTRKNNVFMNSLYLRSVDYENAGFYACIIKLGSADIELQLFELKIEQVNGNDSTRIILIATISGAVLFLFIFSFACIYNKYRNKTAHPSNRSTKSSSSGSTCVYKKCTPTPPPHQNIMLNYYKQQQQPDFGLISYHTISSNDGSYNSRDRGIGYSAQHIPPAPPPSAQFV